MNIKALAPKLKFAYGRKHPINYKLCIDALKRSDIAKDYAGQNTTIIDAYPGAGVWSSALHEIVKPTKHILLEPAPKLVKLLEDNVTPASLASGNVVIKPEDPFRWGTFTSLVNDKVYEPVKFTDRSRIHPNILYTANLTSIQGEQLCFQYLNCAMNQSWLQSYGRVRMLFWIRHSTAQKLLARAGSKFRGRVSVQAETCTESRLLVGSSLHDDATSDVLGAGADLLLHEPKDFYPEATKTTQFALVQIDPREKPVEHIDYFEYVIRTLFILKSRPLHEAISILGPGASQDLIPKITDAALLERAPTEMTVEDFATVTRVFAMWPFKPDILHDFYDDDMAPS